MMGLAGLQSEGLSYSNFVLWVKFLRGDGDAVPTPRRRRNEASNLLSSCLLFTSISTTIMAPASYSNPFLYTASIVGILLFNLVMSSMYFYAGIR
jgi:hypothetical protein